MTVSDPTVMRTSGDGQARTRRRVFGVLFYVLTIGSTVLGIAMLAVLLIDVFADGANQVDGHFLTSYPSRFPEQAGLRSALLGTLWMLGLTAILAFPIGVGAAIYLEEYAPANWMTRFIQLNIANLAGVPSVVYGLLGLSKFVVVKAFSGAAGVGQDAMRSISSVLG